jgi:hypothetical protein
MSFALNRSYVHMVELFFHDEYFEIGQMCEIIQDCCGDMICSDEMCMMSSKGYCGVKGQLNN